MILTQEAKLLNTAKMHKMDLTYLSTVFKIGTRKLI